MLKQPSIEEMLASAGGPRRAPPATGPGAAAVQPHRFWDTQPVPKLGASQTHETVQLLGGASSWPLCVGDDYDDSANCPALLQARFRQPWRLSPARSSRTSRDPRSGRSPTRCPPGLSGAASTSWCHSS